MLEILRFKSSLSFGTHTLLVLVLVLVLHLSIHRSNLIANG